MRLPRREACDGERHRTELGTLEDANLFSEDREKLQKAKTCADEAVITKDPAKVERRKRQASTPKLTDEEKQAAKAKEQKADKAEVAKKYAVLRKEDKKRKERDDYHAGRCYMCKEEGHITINCLIPICSKCGEGHHVRHCPEILCEGCDAYKVTDDQGQTLAHGHLYW